MEITTMNESRAITAPYTRCCRARRSPALVEGFERAIALLLLLSSFRKDLLGDFLQFLNCHGFGQIGIGS